MYGAEGFAHSKRDEALAKETLDSFYDTWLLKRPKCGDRRGIINERGQIDDIIPLRNLPREEALAREYIQVNHPRAATMMAFDIDNDYAVEDLLEKIVQWGMIPPNIVTRNPRSGHAHVIYFLSGKVLRDPYEMGHAFRYMESVREYMEAVLEADPSYNENITQNPFSPKWSLFVGGGRRHNLGDLAENFRSIMLDRGLGKASCRTEPLFDRDSDAAAMDSRNCMMFESMLRISAKEYRADGYPQTPAQRNAFVKAMEDLAHGALNSDIAAYLNKSPMSISEVRGIVKSATSFVFRRNSEVKFLAHQRVMGRLRRRVDHEYVVEEFRKGSKSVSELAMEFRVHYSTIYRILRVNDISVSSNAKYRRPGACREYLKLLLLSSRDRTRKRLIAYLGTDDPKVINRTRVKISRARKAFPYWSAILDDNRSMMARSLASTIKHILKQDEINPYIDEYGMAETLKANLYVPTHGEGWFSDFFPTLYDTDPIPVVKLKLKKQMLRRRFWAEVEDEVSRVKEDLGLAA